jgi:hypothetical protein
MLLRRYSIVWLLTAAAAVLSWISPAIPRRGGAFLVAAGGAFVAALVQGTGVDYQWYPATVFAGLFVAWLAIMGERRGATATLTTIAIMFAIAVGMRTMAYGNREIGREPVVAALAERLITHASGTPVWIINRDPYPFYPALARTGLVGASRYQSYSFLDAWRRHGPVDTTWVEAVVDGIVADFELHSPRLAILPRRPSAGLDLVIDHPRIRGILAPYIEVEAALGYRFLVRNRP